MLNARLKASNASPSSAPIAAIISGHSAGTNTTINPAAALNTNSTGLRTSSHKSPSVGITPGSATAAITTHNTVANPSGINGAPHAAAIRWIPNCVTSRRPGFSSRPN